MKMENTRGNEIEIDVRQDVIDAVPKVVTALSILPAEKSTVNTEARVDALTLALHGENVTVSELWEAARHFLKNDTFFPVPSRFLTRIKRRRNDWPMTGVLRSDGRIALIKAPTENALTDECRRRYFEEWGRMPDGDRFDCKPDGAIGSDDLQELPLRAEVRRG